MSEKDKSQEPETSPEQSPSLPTASKKVSIIPWLAVAIVCAVIVAWLAQILQSTEEVPDRTPRKFFLPVQFTGKIKLTYGVEGAEPLAVEDGYKIIDVPLSGIVETSSNQEWGRAVDEFYRELPRPNEEGEEYERLSFSHVKVHKSGFVGDENEFYETPEELKNRDPERVAYFEENKEELQQKVTDGITDVGVPTYELFLIRDDI